MNDQEHQAYEEERARFKFLLVENPNYFGNLGKSQFEPVQPISGNTFYEEIGCVGFQPDESRLDAVVYIKRPTGYGGDICTSGTDEFVRFYISFDGGATWTDQGVGSFAAVDVPGTNPERRLEYSTAVRADVHRRLCFREQLPVARAILSWNLEPPPNQPNWRPIWGDVHDTRIQIDPIRFGKIGIDDLVADLGLQMSQPVAKMFSGQQLTMADQGDLKVLSYPALADRYHDKDVEKERFSYPFAVEYLKASGDTALVLGDSDFAIPTELADDAPQGNTSYEELECVGLDTRRSELTAVLRTKRPYGYSGDQCDGGSLEYVTFWADWDADGKFEKLECLGTVSVRTYDYGKEFPEEGLEYSVSLPVDFKPHRQHCKEGPKKVGIRAILSWSTPHPCDRGHRPPHWGNGEDTLVLVPPGDRKSHDDKQPFIDTISNVPVCSIDQGTGYATGQRPFGGVVYIQGEIPAALYSAANRFEYQVTVNRPGDPLSTRVLNNNFGITVKVGTGPGLATQSSITQTAPAGFYTYREYGTAASYPYRRVIGPRHRLLSVWNTLVDEAGIGTWEVTIIGRDTADGTLYAAGTTICVDGTSRQSVALKLDELPPVADISIVGVLVPGGNPLDPNDRTPAADCDTLVVGNTIVGEYTATDDHFRRLVLKTEPDPFAAGDPPPPQIDPTPSVRSYPAVPTAGETGVWWVDTTGWRACGYVIHLDVWDRTIQGGAGWHDDATVGFCLREP